MCWKRYIKVKVKQFDFWNNSPGPEVFRSKTKRIMNNILVCWIMEYTLTASVYGFLQHMFIYTQIVSWDDRRFKRDGQTDGRHCHPIRHFCSKDNAQYMYNMKMSCFTFLIPCDIQMELNQRRLHSCELWVVFWFVELRCHWKKRWKIENNSFCN